MEDKNIKDSLVKAYAFLGSNFQRYRFDSFLSDLALEQSGEKNDTELATPIFILANLSDRFSGYCCLRDYLHAMVNKVQTNYFPGLELLWTPRLFSFMANHLLDQQVELDRGTYLRNLWLDSTTNFYGSKKFFNAVDVQGDVTILASELALISRMRGHNIKEATQRECSLAIRLVYNHFMNKKFLQPGKIFFSPISFLYELSPLVNFWGFPFSDLGNELFVAAHREDISKSPIALAMRVMISKNFSSVYDFFKQDLEQLLAMQEEDGGWPFDSIMYLPQLEKYVGSRALATSFVIKAINS